MIRIEYVIEHNSVAVRAIEKGDGRLSMLAATQVFIPELAQLRQRVAELESSLRTAIDLVDSDQGHTGAAGEWIAAARQLVGPIVGPPLAETPEGSPK